MWRLLFLATLSCTGCDKEAPRPRAPDVWAVWDVESYAELEDLLTVRTCEGWRYVDTFTQGDKMVVVLVRTGPAPPPSDKCRRVPLDKQPIAEHDMHTRPPPRKRPGPPPPSQ